MARAEEPDGGISTEPLDPALFASLAGYLTESVAVVDGEGRVLKMLGPPGGALGLGHVIGRHIFDYCLPEDLPHALDLAVEALASSPGWSSTWQARLRNGEGDGLHFEIYIENRTDDPVVAGFILRLRQLRDESESPIRRDLGRELESLAGGVPLPIAFIASDSRIYYMNDALRALVGDRAAEVEREGLQCLATGEDRAALDEIVTDLLTRPGERTVVFALASPDPKDRRMIEARFTGLGTGGQVLALFGTLVDVTERHDAESELRRQVASDPLTGLGNRNSVERAIVERLARDPDSVGVCYLDLDGFKDVNDTYGHDEGDECLRAVAAILREEAGDGDLVGRLGGDEFAVVVDLDLDGGASRPDRLADLGRRVARAVAAHGAVTGYPVTASVGMALGRLGDSPRELLRRADHAMYEEKRSRRLGGVRGAAL